MSPRRMSLRGHRCPAGAEACFREALAIDPDDAPARRGLGRVLEVLADSEIPYFR